MRPRVVVSSFLQALATELNARESLAVSISTEQAMDFCSPSEVVKGFNWSASISPEAKYDLVVVDAPLSMQRRKFEIGDSRITVRANWMDLYKSLQVLSPSGICVALVEPTAFGNMDGPRFLEALEAEGFSLNGIINVPRGLLQTTGIRPVLVVFSRRASSGLFLAELEEEAQAEKVAGALVKGLSSESLFEGIILNKFKFDGFESLKAAMQLERLETQYKEYKTYTLGEIASEINTVRSGEVLEHKENSIYVPKIGKPSVKSELTEVEVKHHNVFQVVLLDKAKSQYVSAFFQSDLGFLILRSLASGDVIQKIRKTDLSQAEVALPDLKEQEEIVRSHKQLKVLSLEIDKLQKELALNPRNSAEITGQVDSMLELIGELTDADRVMNMAREGESATVEFKESFSLDVRKGTKEKYIELAALKTIVAFLNTDGGVLLVGLNDAGSIFGVNDEVNKFHKDNIDKLLLYFKNQLKERVGEQYYPSIDQRIVRLGESLVLMVECSAASQPCYLDGKDFYVRTNPATDKLEGPKLVEYVQNHFNR